MLSVQFDRNSDMSLPELSEFMHKKITAASKKQVKNSATPQNFNEIKKFIIHEEFEAEIKKLSALIADSKDVASLKKGFLDLCQARELQNKNRITSFSANPSGICNQLYWQLAQMIFQPANLKEMFQIIFPNVTENIVIDYKIKNKPSKAEEKLEFKLKKKNLDELVASKPENPNSDVVFCQSIENSIGDMVFYENGIFKLNQIENLSFQYHQKIYSLLEAHPKLHEKIYTHNLPLQELKEDIVWLRNKGGE